MKLRLLVVSVLGGISSLAAPLTGPVINPANGHFYTLLSSNTWTGSQAEAAALGANLVTINNTAENDWVFDTFSAGERNLWIGLNDVETAGVYKWADGSPFSYSNWDVDISQPDGQGDHWVMIVRSDLGNGLTPRKWHDVIDEPASQFSWIGAVFGVVEQISAPPCTPHGAKATAKIVNGSVVGAVMTDSGCGYTNAPLVLIQGGGGSGATATAILINGVVSGINITSGGCCYTTNPAPKIVIASPPFVPSVSIAVSRVNVKQRVILGRNYQLESSSNMSTWTPAGAPFTADSEEITTEFVVSPGVRYFRIRQMP